MNIAAQLNGPLHFPTMLVADLFWSSAEDAETVFRRNLKARRDGENQGEAEVRIIPNGIKLAV